MRSFFLGSIRSFVGFSAFLGMFFRFVMFVFGLLVLATGISTVTALRRESPGFQSGDERRDTV